MLQLFPNNTQKSPVVQPDEIYSLTTSEITILADSPDVPESIFCYAREDFLPEKYRILTNTAYLPLKVDSVERIHQWHNTSDKGLPYYFEYNINIENQI